MDILTLLGFKSEEFESNPTYIEEENEITIYVELKIPHKRKCINKSCLSHEIYIKDVRYESIKHQCLILTNKPIIVVIKKRRFICKNCGISWTQETLFVNKYCNISNEVKWNIAEDLKELISYSTVARKYKISTHSVMNIFDEIVRVGRAAMPTCLCIDEKRFTTDSGKYICLLGNARTGEVIDVISSRKKAYLNEYFEKIPEIERKNVKFFSSDMFEGYRTVKEKYFPDAIHIVDHFHIKKLFTDTLQIIRRSYMNSLSEKSEEYKFLKNKWRYFLINPYSKKAEKMNEIDNETGEIISVKDLITFTVRNSCHSLLEIYNLYSDFCQYMTEEYSDEELIFNLEFIIEKAVSSTNNYIRKLGKTLLSFSTEILNFFQSSNMYKMSNANAEYINSAIDKLINNSNGLRNYRLFRKRILHCLKHKKGE